MSYDDIDDLIRSMKQRRDSIAERIEKLESDLKTTKRELNRQEGKYDEIEGMIKEAEKLRDSVKNSNNGDT